MSAPIPPQAIGAAIAEWYRLNARDLPWRRAGFTPWGTLVSEFMLQQTPVARVVPRLEQWLTRWPTPAALAADPAGEAVRAWDRLGYPRRALNLHACAVAIVERHGGVVPDDVDALLDLPGVGPYTARAVAAFAFGKRHPVVDTNVRRVVCRAIEGRSEAGPPSTRRDLLAMEAMLPLAEDEAQRVNAGTMELGAIVCTARSPRCGECPISRDCAWHAAGYPASTEPRRPAQKRYEGSDRQVRGLILGALRESEVGVPAAAVWDLWPDAAQLHRALTGLVTDGLAVLTPDGYGLP